MRSLKVQYCSHAPPDMSSSEETSKRGRGIALASLIIPGPAIPKCAQSAQRSPHRAHFTEDTGGSVSWHQVGLWGKGQASCIIW